MIDRLLATLDIDAVQWRALTRTYLRMDMRRTGGPRQANETKRQGLHLYRGLLIVTFLQSGVIAALCVALKDTFTAAVFLTTFAALNTGLLLIADFAGFVVSPDDYWILGSRPVSDRTYFAARLASVLAHVLVVAAALALLPAFALGLWHGLGLIGVAAAFTASILCSLSATVVTIAVYAALMTRVRPERLARLVGYLQLVATLVFFGGYAFVMRAFEEAKLRQLAVRDVDWIWAAPSTWFAALIPLLAGAGGTREWIAVAAATIVTAACAPLAAGRLSLDYAERLSQATSVRSTATRAGRGFRIPGFRRGEAEAVATLIRAQFRNDMRFRMAILAILPMTAFYMMMAGGSLSDPFVSDADAQGMPIYFAIVFMPMTLHGALKHSDSWRAAWIFFATPADPARLVVAAKNFVTVFFLGSYVLLLSVVASFYYERVWHAFVHMAVVGAVAHLLLQTAVIVSPDLPFASEPRKAEHSSRFLVVMMFGSIVGFSIPLLMPFAYTSAIATIAVIALLIGATAGLELLLRARARAAVLAMEL